MILHLKSPNVICINQQSDLLMYTYSLGQKKGDYSSGTLYHIKMEGTPHVTSTYLNIPKLGCFLQRFILCSKMEQFVYLFGRIDALLQGFLVLLHSILSEPGDEKTCLRGFGPVKIQSGLLSYRC